MESIIDDKTIRMKVEKSLNTLLKNDGYLLEHDVNERSITHRMAIYLEKEFKEWNVDCEYNRNFDAPKRIQGNSHGVYPDIIVHHRGTNLNNLLAIEVKKTTNQGDKQVDIKKLRQYMRVYGYRFTLWILLKTGHTEDIGVLELEWVSISD